MEIVKTCPLCGGDAHKPFDQRKFRNRAVENQICLTCGGVFQSPRMTETELVNFYTAEYRQLYQGDDKPETKTLSIQHGRAESLYFFVKDKITPPTWHLDIGSSAGILLARFCERYQCQAVGVEPGDSYRAYSKSQGLTVYRTLEELAEVDMSRFDLISMAHVLEHVPDPAAYLSRLRQNFLAEGGHLLLEVPNLYAHECFEVAHLFSFSRHTLIQTVQKAGFKVLALKQHGQPRSVILPLYLTLLAQPVHGFPPDAEHVIRREKRVALKRRVGMFQRRILQRIFPDLAWIPTPVTARAA